MKLKAFNSENCISKRHGKPYVAINFKTGLFRINKECCEKIGLNSGDKISFHQDEAEEKDCYLQVNDEKGFELRAKENVTSGVLFNNSTLAHTIATVFAFEGKSVNLLIGSESIKHERKIYWPLITAVLVIKK